MADNNEPKDPDRKQHTRQIPSVPFLWEVRPGMPNKDWKPEASPPIPRASSCFLDPIDPPTLLLLPPPLLDSRGSVAFGPLNDGYRSLMLNHKDEPSSIPQVPSHPLKFVASVPFVWEEKPGKPLPYVSPVRTEVADFLLPLPPPPSWNSYEDEVSSTGSNNIAVDDVEHERDGAYKPNLQSFTFEISENRSVPRAPSRPLKLVASVPFVWEERPGKPLSGFPEANPPPPPESYGRTHDVCYDPIDPDNKHREGFFECEIESFSFEADLEGSFSSSQSLLANRIMPSSAISAAVPVEETGHLSSSYSSSSSSLWALDAESSTSSYATGASGPVGPAFLEWLFPLFPPKSGFLERSRSPERVANQQPEGRDISLESNGSLVWRRPTMTLGQLIMMSRRMSYRRKAVNMRNQNSSMHEFVKKSASGCGMLGHKLMEGFNLKRQLRLKLA